MSKETAQAMQYLTSHLAHRNETVSEQNYKCDHINYDSMKVPATTSKQLVNVSVDAHGPNIHARNRQTTKTDHNITKHAHRHSRFALTLVLSMFCNTCRGSCNIGTYCAHSHTRTLVNTKQRTFSTSCEILLRWVRALLANNHPGHTKCKMLMQKKIRCRPKHIFNETLIACMDLRAERTTQNNAGESSESEKLTVYAQFSEHRRTDLQLWTKWCCFVGIKQGIIPVFICFTWNFAS